MRLWAQSSTSCLQHIRPSIQQVLKECSFYLNILFFFEIKRKHPLNAWDHLFHLLYVNSIWREITIQFLHSGFPSIAFLVSPSSIFRKSFHETTLLTLFCFLSLPKGFGKYPEPMRVEANLEITGPSTEFKIKKTETWKCGITCLESHREFIWVSELESNTSSFQICFWF